MAAAVGLAAYVRRGLGSDGVVDPVSLGSDPLREQVDACLDGLAELARVEGMLAAVKVQLAAGFAEKSLAVAAPARSPGESTAQEMALIAEVACVLAVSERSAGALLAESLQLTTALPLTLAALQDGPPAGVLPDFLQDDERPEPGRIGQKVDVRAHDIVDEQEQRSEIQGEEQEAQ